MAVPVKISELPAAGALTGAELAPVVKAGVTSQTTATAMARAFAGQLPFPATQIPSADANTLDDYEEGTFTPALEGVSTAGVGTYSQQVGRYTKIGNRVFFDIAITWSAHTGTGQVKVIGFPVTVAAGGANVAAALSFVSVTYSGHPIALLINSTTTALIYDPQSNGAQTLAIEAAGSLLLSGHYPV